MLTQKSHPANEGQPKRRTGGNYRVFREGASGLRSQVKGVTAPERRIEAIKIRGKQRLIQRQWFGIRHGEIAGLEALGYHSGPLPLLVGSEYQAFVLDGLRDRPKAFVKR